MPLDAVETNPDHYSVLFENDRVRVLRLDGSDTPLTPHEHPDSIVISGGEVRWMNAQDHTGASFSSTNAILVELKEGLAQESEHPVLPGLGPSEDPNASGNRPSSSLLND